VCAPACLCVCVHSLRLQPPLHAAPARQRAKGVSAAMHQGSRGIRVGVRHLFCTQRGNARPHALWHARELPARVQGGRRCASLPACVASRAHGSPPPLFTRTHTHGGAQQQQTQAPQQRPERLHASTQVPAPRHGTRFAHPCSRRACTLAESAEA